MKQTLIGISALFLLVVFPFFAYAEDTAGSITPPGQLWRKEAQELREDIKEEREDMREDIQDARVTLIQENKMEREEFREKTKEQMEGKTKEERKLLRPTIVQERKNLIETNKMERETLRKDVAVKKQSLRQTIITRWQNLWSSIFGKK